MIRALITDDEPLARRGIRQFLSEYADVTIVGECRTGREAVSAINGQAPDLIFLDIEMPDLDGMHIIDVVGRDRMPLIVFVTAHEQFAVRAFDARAIDYLVKPLTSARFRDAMARVREQIHSERQEEGRIVVSTSKGQRVIDVVDIDWVEANDVYSNLHVGSNVYTVREPIGTLAARLGSNRFLRVHRSCLVRLDRVVELRRRNRKDTVVRLRSGIELPVGRRRVGHIRACLRQTEPTRLR